MKHIILYIQIMCGIRYEIILYSELAVLIAFAAMTLQDEIGRDLIKGLLTQPVP